MKKRSNFLNDNFLNKNEFSLIKGLKQFYDVSKYHVHIYIYIYIN